MLTCPPWTYLNLRFIHLDEGAPLDLELDLRLVESLLGLAVLDCSTSW